MLFSTGQFGDHSPGHFGGFCPFTSDSEQETKAVNCVGRCTTANSKHRRKNACLAERAWHKNTHRTRKRPRESFPAKDLRHWRGKMPDQILQKVYSSQAHWDEYSRFAIFPCSEVQSLRQHKTITKAIRRKQWPDQLNWTTPLDSRT